MQNLYLLEFLAEASAKTEVSEDFA
jgi:hypothetical protein